LLRHLRSDRGARFFQAKPISADLKDTRRFAPEQVLEYLRNSARPETDFSAALRARDVRISPLPDRALVKGNELEDLLDKCVGPALRGADPQFCVRPAFDVDVHSPSTQ
jgi:hypothetical protein